MARTKDPAIRTLLIERAARMLRTREPITLRSLVAGTGVSTMAVYTHLGGMDGMWRALRQEGFSRLRARLATVTTTADPIRDVAAVVAAYIANALAEPDLYRVMFDATVDLEDARAADELLEGLVQTIRRGREARRLRDDTDPVGLAIQVWVVAHGLASLVATGPLPRQALDSGPPMLTAVLTDAGDQPDRCRASVELGWRESPIA